jgi:hypothetical protein
MSHGLDFGDALRKLLQVSLLLSQLGVAVLKATLSLHEIILNFLNFYPHHFFDVLKERARGLLLILLLAQPRLDRAQFTAEDCGRLLGRVFVLRYSVRERLGFCDKVFTLDFDVADGLKLTANLVTKLLDSGGDALVYFSAPA